MTQADQSVDLDGTADVIRGAMELCAHAGAAILPSSTGFTTELESALMMVSGGRNLLINILGPVKAGKTAVVNAFAGAQVLPSSTEAQTALPVMMKFDAGRTNFRLVSKAPPPTQSDSEEEQLQRLRFDKFVTTDHVAIEGSAKDVREAVLALTGRIRAARITRDSTASSEAAKSAAQAELDSISMLELTCPRPEWLASVPTQILARLSFMDTPGRGELHNSHVQQLADKCLYEADILITVCDYTKLNTESAAEMFRVGAVARPELSGTGGGSQRTIILVNRIDIQGMGALPVATACTMAQNLAMREMNLQEAPDAFGISALQKNRSFGWVEGDDMVKQMLRGSSSKYRTFNMSDERLKAYNWSRLATRSGFADLERRLLQLATVELPGLSVATAKSQAGVALASWRERALEMVADLSADATTSQQEVDALRNLQRDLTQLLEDKLNPFIARVSNELRHVNDELADSVATLLTRAESACKQLVKDSVFESQQAAEDYARMCFATISEAFLRSLETARSTTAAKVTTVLRNASQRAVSQLWPELKARLSEVLGAEALERCRLLLTGRGLTEELEVLRDTLIAPVMAPRGLVQEELEKHVTKHTFTVTKQRIVQKTVNVKVGSWFFSKTVSLPSAEIQNYDAQAVNYPVVVSTMTDLAKELIQALANQRVAQCAQVLTEELSKFDTGMRRAITQPVRDEVHRMEDVIETKLAGEQEVNSRCATLREFAAAVEVHQQALGFEHLNDPNL